MRALVTGFEVFGGARANASYAAVTRLPARVTTVKRWFLYLIECRDGNIYTGVAVDVAARYAAHVKGKGARYTRSHPPNMPSNSFPRRKNVRTHCCCRSARRLLNNA